MATVSRLPVTLEKDFGAPVTDRLLAPFRAKSRARLELESRPEALKRVYHHMTLTDDGRFLFTCSAKCACTAIRQILFRYSRGSFSGAIEKERTFRQGTEYWRDFEAAIAEGEAMVFTFVRDPERRLVSAFTNRFVDVKKCAKDHLGPMEARGYDPARCPDENFEVFLRYVEDSFAVDPEQVDRYWRLQTLNVGWGVIDYDFIGKVETFNADMLRLFGMGGRGDFLTDEMLNERFNKSSEVKVNVKEGQSARIRALYAADYETFGYR